METNPAHAENYQPVPRKPRLIWEGKSQRTPAAEPLPAQTVEIIRPFYANAAQSALHLPSDAIPDSRLIWTNDNLVALTSLLHGDDVYPPLAGKVDLVYIDPPFAVQSDFKINIEIDGGMADEKTPTLIEEIAYRDTWQRGLDSYLTMLRDRLYLIKALLAPTGSIYVHCDWHAGHYIKVLMDEVFGYENFRNEVIWRYLRWPAKSPLFQRSHDTLFWYGKSKDTHTWNQQFTELSAETLKRFGGKKVKGETTKEVLDEESAGAPMRDVWEMPHVLGANPERGNYPTQKPIALLERIIAASSNPGDLILDCFCGSGTTCVAAETMKDKDGSPARRRWIGIDCGKFAIHTTRKRLIEANAQPFAVQNIGFYERGKRWSGVENKSAEARRYRVALIELYGGHADDIEGFAYLHGKKGVSWVHVGPLDAPVTAEIVGVAARECAENGGKSLDVLTADIAIDFPKSKIEQETGVSVTLKVIPQAALEEVRKRLARKGRRDAGGEGNTDSAVSSLHFFSPPDFETRIVQSESGLSVTIHLTRLNIGDLEESLQTQDAKKRDEIKKAVTDWRALVDYWAVDWEYNGQFFRNDWQTFRTRKKREFALQAAHEYTAESTGARRIAVKVTDIFGNDGLRVYAVEPSVAHSGVQAKGR